MAFGEEGAAALRATNVSAIVKQVAEQTYKFKNLLASQSSTAWIESFHRESASELRDSGIEGVPRMSDFPSSTPEWEKIDTTMAKFALESEVSIEDESTNNIPMMLRIQRRLGRRIAKQVDDRIWAVISESQSPSDINEVATASGSTWDNATRADRHPQEQILEAEEKIGDNFYEADLLIINRKDFRLIIQNDDILDAYDPKNNLLASTNISGNGMKGTLAGLQMVVSASVTADNAMVMESKTAATWAAVSGLRVTVETVEGIKKILKAWEIGVTQLTDPKAITLITNTNS